MSFATINRNTKVVNIMCNNDENANHLVVKFIFPFMYTDKYRMDGCIKGSTRFFNLFEYNLCLLKPFESIKQTWSISN